MNILTNERLNKIASWRETYGTNTNVMIPAKEADELVQRLLTAEKKLADLYAQKPFMHWIGDPDGNAYFDECCVGNVGLMDAQVTNLNDDLDESDPRYSVVALYREPIPDERNERIAELEAQLAELGKQEPVFKITKRTENPRLTRWGYTSLAELADGEHELYARPAPQAINQPSVINLTDEQIDSVLDSRGNILYVIGDKRERLRLFAREILRVASAQLINAVPLHIVPDELPEVPDGDAELDSYNKDKTDS
ncbi:hypothetical protein ACIPR7_18300 [Pectobacterium parvum]|uniref:hypothetical protein n=1 Tax=Pectobacterium TaxID=122277 RepID=UPI0005C6D376|nr:MULTISPECIES: hypothetical protein [Pectobacterium]MCU1793516.1 hypothetical protein [Pectobacterium polaris]